MASEVIKLNLIPKGEMPVFHASQFDTGRLITCELYRGEDAYSVPEGYTVELHCRKVDNNIVTMASTLINDNVVTFTSTEQLTACNGKNLCEVAILDDGYRIGTLNFILEVEIDPLKGGITSTSEIHNLETQVEEITTEIIGENYYNKTEVDDLLDTKADASSVYTKTQVDSALALKANAAAVYTKSQTDTLLNAKADVSDLPDMTDYYTKTATDALLDDKANVSDVYTKTQTDTALATKADKTDTYTKEQVDALIDSIFPTFTASGSIATFTTALTKPLVSVITAEGATTITRCGVNLFDKTTVLNGYINDSNGVFSANANYKATDYIPIKGGQNYYVMTSQSGANWGAWYDSEKNYISALTNYTNKVKTAPANACYARLTIWGTNEGGNVDSFGMNYPATDTTYHPYTGNTVPVSDATTLITESGVNNVFANVGDVTVGYKYMPMPETQTNSNRLLLSSVNSDIIKEKSEIKEQSDIIEDIERGNKDE